MSSFSQILRAQISPLITEAQALIAPDSLAAERDVASLLDKYGKSLKVAGLNVDASAADALRTWEGVCSRLSVFENAIKMPRAISASYWQEGLRVGLGLCCLFPKDGETVDDFISRFEKTLVENDPRLSENPILHSDHMEEVNPRGSDSYRLFREGDLFFKVMPDGVLPMPHLRGVAYYLMREMMVQGAVALSPEPASIPLWPIDGIVTLDGRTALKMRYCPSGAYKQALFKSLSASDWEEMEAMIACLAYLHSKGLAHLDVKPSNYLRTPQGPKLIDCGLASHHLLKRASGYGTPFYFYKNPEQANADPCRRDVHAMAVSLCELVFEPAMISPLVNSSDYFFPLLSSLPPQLQRVLKRALSDIFEDKHENANQLLDDFRLARKETSAG